ncbi:MAG TPA: hypothetical protein VJO72_08270 [Candidatus Dormibacteraeota bacterium]|nr:hypothetical protein [Candidatus Dormibacteraeota bacterium]
MSGPSMGSPLRPKHPELDLPEGDCTWAEWLEARSRLETVLLLMGDRQDPYEAAGNPGSSP